MKNKGFKVIIKLQYPDEKEPVENVYRNVTEIHYLYKNFGGQKRVAFESDIHLTGLTHDVKYVVGFDAKLEEEIAGEF